MPADAIAWEMENKGLPYEMDYVVQLPHMLNGATDGNVGIFAETQRKGISRIFYGYWPEDKVDEKVDALMRMRSVKHVHLVRASAVMTRLQGVRG